MRKRPVRKYKEKDKLRTRGKRQQYSEAEKPNINQHETILQEVILIPPDNAGLSNGCIILPQTPSSLPDLIPCAEKPNCMNVVYTQMTGILSWSNY